MSSPRVSVVMAAYNAPQFIPASIESILNQEYQDFELIIVDDGSPIDIPSVLAPYRDKLRYVRQENMGLGGARDTGVAASKGEYIAFADSDDIHLPFRLGAQVALLDAYPTAALTSGDFSTMVDEKITNSSSLRIRDLGVDTRDLTTALRSAFGRPVNASSLDLPIPKKLQSTPVYHGRVPTLIAGRHIVWEMASMFRADQLKSMGGHDISLRNWEDWHVISRMSKRFEIVFWDAPMIHYRQHSGQITAQPGPSSIRYYRDVVLSVWKDDPDLARDHPQLRKQILKSAMLRYAGNATEEGDYSKARKEILDYIRAVPKSRSGYRALASNMLRDLVLSKVLPSRY